MNYAKLIISCTFAGLLLSLAGCAKKSTYKPHHLKSLKESANIDYQETKEQVTIRAKAFTENDCEYVFAERTDRITKGKHPLQPIQLCIENNSSSPWKLLDSNIGLSMVPSKQVEQRLSNGNPFIASAICGGIGIFGLLAGITITLVAHPIGVACYLTEAIMALGGCGCISTPFVFLIDYYGIHVENSEITKFIYQTHIVKTASIPPSKTIDLLIFVQKKMYQPQFKLTLVTENQECKKLPFLITLNP